MKNKEMKNETKNQNEKSQEKKEKKIYIKRMKSSEDR